MSKVLITRSKLDGLATTIAAKSGATLPLTIAQMDAAVDGIDTSGSNYVVTLSYNDQTEMWEPDCTYAEVSAAYQAGKDIVAAVDLYETDATADSFYQSSNNAFIYCVHYPRGERFVGAIYVLTSSGLEEDETWEAIWPNFESTSRTYTPTTQQQTETITYDSSQGYNGIQQVNVTVNAMPSGNAGTPTATKGTVSNHAVSVTPSVTNTTGYITGGTKTGTAVSVSASELVSGTLSITSSGTKDVTNYASASVAAGGATASATKGTVSNHSVTVTPSVTRTAGYVTAGSSNGTAVTVSASELVSGTYTVDSSGTKDVTNYASASVAAGSATASATKGSVSNHSISVTPSVTRTAGWVSAGTASGTAVTVSASELVSGSETKTENGTYDVTNLASLVVDVDGYTLTTVCPQQTITPNSDRIAYPVGSFDYEVGEFYLVTFDGVEYVTSCALCWETNHVIGDTRVIWNDVVTVAPFCAITTSVTDKEVYCRDTNTHTIKVEHLELGTPAATLTTKSITSNGTYNASSDNADGYSSVTVNVSGGGSPTLQSKTATPTTSQQVIQPDNGYDGLSQVTVNAIPSQYIVPSGNKAITANGNNIDVAEYATVSVNVSSSSKNVQVAQSTTRVANTAYTKTASLTCSVSGKYDVYWDCFRSTTSGTSGSQLYIGGSAYGSANTTFSSNIHAQNNHLTNVQINANQEVAVYVRSRATNYYAYCGQLTIVQTA